MSKMLTPAGQVFFLLALVGAAEISSTTTALQTPAISDPHACDSQGGAGYDLRICGDICLPVGQFCCNTLPNSPLWWGCPIGQVCNNQFINDWDYLARCCNSASCIVVTPFPSTSYIPISTAPPSTSTTLPSSPCGPELEAEGYGYRSCGGVCLPVDQFCCPPIPNTNLVYSCEIYQLCSLYGDANDPQCCYASGYCLDATPFVNNSTETSAIPQSTAVSTIPPPTQTTSSSGLATSITGGPPPTTTTTQSGSPTTGQSPVSATGTVSVSPSLSKTNATSPSSPSFTGAAARYSLKTAAVYVLGGLFVGVAAGDLGLF